ncbi:MAG TPA: hypothetical protein VFB54_00935 [Burkholderiales bacterium]|nr:hypothetical protein [Burkholderiales bacterium]
MRLLFIGNSYTARHDLPRLIAEMAASATPPCSIESELIFAGGASLRRHWNAGRALAAIERGGWDYVILQEQSTLPIKNRVRFHENVRLFDAAIRDAGAATALYLTWARAGSPMLQEAITRAVTDIADDLHALVIPAGVAWQAVLRDHPEIALHLPDGSHPTSAGAYLTACVFVATLLGVSPIGLAVPRALALEQATASVLQRCADAAVRHGGPGNERAGVRAT